MQRLLLQKVEYKMHMIVKMHTSGAKGFLIGSSIMSSDDISAATRAFAEAY